MSLFRTADCKWLWSLLIFKHPSIYNWGDKLNHNKYMYELVIVVFYFYMVRIGHSVFYFYMVRNGHNVSTSIWYEMVIG
jgi:hypothetical protein